MLGYAGETRLTIRYPHLGRLRQPERVVTVQEHREHVGSADDRDVFITSKMDRPDRGTVLAEYNDVPRRVRLDVEATAAVPIR